MSGAELAAQVHRRELDVLAAGAGVPAPPSLSWRRATRSDTLPSVRANWRNCASQCRNWNSLSHSSCGTMSSWALQLRCGARRLARRLRLSSGQGSLRKPRRNDRGPSCGGGNSSFQPRSELIYSAPSRGHPLLPTDRESGPDRLTTCLREVGPTHLSSRLVQRNEEVETKP